MATKKTGTPSKGKATAAANAQQRGQRQRHLAEAPRATRSNKAADQDRAVHESPLQGADRPLHGRRGKVDRTDPNIVNETMGGRTRIHPGEATLRRARSKSRRRGQT